MSLSILLIAVLLSAGLYFQLRIRNPEAQQRLTILIEDDPNFADSFATNYNWKKAQKLLGTHRDRLGRAGLLTSAQRRNCIMLLAGIALLCVACGLTFGASGDSLLEPVIGFFVGGYAALLIAWVYLQRLEAEYQRKILFSLPLTLESLILLVETGLGILPAIAQLVQTAKEEQRNDAVIDLLSIVYDFSSNGMEFTQALELVAHASPVGVFRHALLHLDLSGSEGGEIIPSLRSLSDHTHKEWKLSVEQRVRRLENLVVFPVFVSVIGLLLLTAAVPLVPVMQLRESLKASKLNKDGDATSTNQPQFFTPGGPRQ